MFRVAGEAGYGISNEKEKIEKLTAQARFLLVALTVAGLSNKHIRIPDIYEAFKTYRQVKNLPAPTDSELFGLLPLLSESGLLEGGISKFGTRHGIDNSNVSISIVWFH